MDGYTYDAAGNLTYDGVYYHGYDAENRITSVTQGGRLIASYVYDAEGRQVQKTAGAQVEYLYDLDGNIVTAGGWNRGEVFTNGQHLATYNWGTTYFNKTDWLSTERDRSGTADANCESITSLPFGDAQSASGTVPTKVHSRTEQPRLLGAECARLDAGAEAIRICGIEK